MPVYEYICRHCGHRFDLLRAMREADAPLACPTCGATETKRVPSVVATQTNCAPTGG